MRSHRKDDSTKRYPILSDQPVEIHNPQRKAKLITAAWITALVMCSFTAAYVATTIAIEQNDDSKAQLQAELEQRSKQRDVEANRFQHALDQYRIDQCHITARLPQDPAIVDIRQRYRCTDPVVPTPTSPQPPATAPSPAGSRLQPAQPARPPPKATPGAPAPAPRPTAPVPPPPPPPPPPPVPPPPPPVPPPPPPPPVCLPVLGICLI